MSAPWRAPAAVPEYRMSVPRLGPWLIPEITRSIPRGHQPQQRDHHAVRGRAAAGEPPLGHRADPQRVVQRDGMRAAALLRLPGPPPRPRGGRTESCIRRLDPVAVDSVVVGEQEPHALCTLFSTIRAPAEGRQTYTSGLNPKMRSYWRMCSW